MPVIAYRAFNPVVSSEFWKRCFEAVLPIIIDWKVLLNSVKARGLEATGSGSSGNV